MRRVFALSILFACAAARAQFGFIQRIEVPPPAKSLTDWIAPGIETAHFVIRSESIMAGSREELGKHLEEVHAKYFQSLALSAYMSGSPLASPQAAEKTAYEAEKEGRPLRRTGHARVFILPDRTLVSLREGGGKVVTFPDGSRAIWDGESWKMESTSERLRGKCDVWLLPTEGQYRAFLFSYYPDRAVTSNALYDPDADRIVAWESPDHKAAVTSELVRRLLSCAFGATPPWLEEGLSRLSRESESGEVRPLSVEATRKLRYMVLKGGYAPLSELVKMNSSQFHDSVNRAMYARQSSGVVEFLARVDGGKHLNSFLRKLREGVPVKDAFKAAFGGPRKVQGRWIDYLVSRSARVKEVEGLRLLRCERRDAGPGRGGRMYSATVRQRRVATLQGLELWVYMVVTPRNALSPEGKLLIGRWTWDEFAKGDKTVSGSLSQEEKERWGEHPSIVRAELYWNGQLVAVDVNGAYPLNKWWQIVEPVKWLNR